ncbi:hypothetical protein [uncultured Desulfobulbus sp.]|uniref:hypothetical protein n=1 Tax=uncultured Desulfobulbus sp. TaxID=239745 RepID=UPI0029C890C4|nr:hypothetical protein [uncultured Desulfobulbus sp.]
MKNDKSILGYKQAPGCKTWQVIPNLSLDKVEQATQPKANGLQDGSQNYPPAGYTDRAETENRVIYQAEEYLANVNDHANKEMTDIDRKIQETAVTREDTFSDLTASADKEFQHYLLQVQPELQRLRVEERQQLRYFKLFKAKNRLERLASYPESRWFNFAVLAFCVLCECVANMYFFAAGSQLGLLGGFSQAFIISVCNVGVSFYVGRFALPNICHINWLRKVFGVLAFICWCIGIFAYHLVVAHYRDMLAVDASRALTGAVAKCMADPLGLQSLDSVLVLVIGWFISIVTIIDGFKFDDRYPGFGEEDRKYQQKRLAYEAKEKEVRDRMADSIHQAEKQVAERLQQHEHNHARTSDLYTGATSVVDHFSNVYNQVDEIVNAAISKYRTANRQIRTDADPASFATMPKVKRLIEVEKFHRQLDQFKAVKDTSSGLLEQNRRHAAMVQTALAGSAASLIERMDRLAEDVSTKAEKEISIINQEV